METNGDTLISNHTCAATQKWGQWLVFTTLKALLLACYGIVMKFYSKPN